MKTNEKLYIWDKSEKSPINKYFNTEEFSCQCKNKECVEQKISIELIKDLTELREELGKPITITSGFRCSAHQKEVSESGVSTVVAKKSQHEEGEAADCKFTGYTVAQVLPYAEKRFKAIGVAKTFLHLDTRKDKIRRWTY